MLAIKKYACATVMLSSAAAFGIGGAAAQEDVGVLRAQRAKIVALTQECMRQMTAVNNRRGPLAARGILLPDPPCASNMPQWISQEAFLETRIARSHGDPRRPCDINGIYTPGCRPR